MTTAVERRVETLTCHRCGAQWNRAVKGGCKPLHCAECKGHSPCPICSAVCAQRQAGEKLSPEVRLASRITTYRRAITLAVAELHRGNPQVALLVLETAVPPHPMGSAVRG